jgi:indolepyruvate ferredoxin oxidoreductase, beta subunit
MVNEKELNLIVAGVGGQGSVLASHIIADAAVKAGLKARVGETFGAAMRGGAVSSHIRIGTDVRGPLVAEDKLDILIALEPLEALRIGVKYLSPDGIALINTKPMPSIDVNIGKSKYPEISEVTASLQKLCKKVVALDATELAIEAGTAKALNILMLGMAAATGLLPFSTEILKETIKERVPKGTEDKNISAFDSGYEAAKGLL